MLRLLVISEALHLAVDVGGRRFWTPFLGRQTSYQGSFALVNNHYGFTRPMTRGVDRNLYPFTAGVPRRSLTDAERLADEKRRTGPVLGKPPFAFRVKNISSESRCRCATCFSWQAVLPVGKVFGAGFGRCGAYRQGDRSGIRPGSLRAGPIYTRFRLAVIIAAQGTFRGYLARFTVPSGSC
jgi:hypothetical protein